MSFDPLSGGNTYHSVATESTPLMETGATKKPAKAEKTDAPQETSWLSKWPDMKACFSSIRSITSSVFSFLSNIKDWSCFNAFASLFKPNAKMDSSLSKLFQESFDKGNVQVGTNEETVNLFTTAPKGPEERITMRSNRILNTKEIGYENGGFGPKHTHDALIPECYTRVLGKNDRERLVDTFLYKSSTNKSIIRGELESLQKEHSEVGNTLQFLGENITKLDLAQGELEKATKEGNKGDIETAQEKVAFLKEEINLCKKPWRVIRRVTELRATMAQVKDNIAALSPDQNASQLKELNDRVQAITSELANSMKTDDVIAANSSEELTKKLEAKLEKASQHLQQFQTQTNGFETWSSENLFIHGSITTLITGAEGKVTDAEKIYLKKVGTLDEQTAKQSFEHAKEELTFIQQETQGFEAWPINKSIHYIKLSQAKRNLASKGIDFSALSNDEILLHERALDVKWDRVLLTIELPNTTDPSSPTQVPVECSNKKALQENITLFRNALSTLSGKSISDNELYEMMSLINSEGISAGYPDGTDPSIGLALGREAKEGAMDSMKISFAEDGTFHFDFKSGASFLNGIVTPTKEEKMETYLSFTDSGKIDRNLEGDHKDIPQFEIDLTYTYGYKPPESGEKNGAVSILDARQMLKPRDMGTVEKIISPDQFA